MIDYLFTGSACWRSSESVTGQEGECGAGLQRAWPLQFQPLSCQQLLQRRLGQLLLHLPCWSVSAQQQWSIISLYSRYIFEKWIGFSEHVLPPITWILFYWEIQSELFDEICHCYQLVNIYSNSTETRCTMIWISSNMTIFHNPIIVYVLTSLLTPPMMWQQSSSFPVASLCFTGYYGTNCTDVCSLNPCEHKSTCTRKLSSSRGYTCDCPSNYFGHYCEKKYCFPCLCVTVCLDRHSCSWTVCFLNLQVKLTKPIMCIPAGLTCHVREVGGVTKPAAPVTVRQTRDLTRTATKPVESVAVRWVYWPAFRWEAFLKTDKYWQQGTCWS